MGRGDSGSQRDSQPGKVQGRDSVRIEEEAREVSIRGKFVLSTNLGYKSRGVAM